MTCSSLFVAFLLAAALPSVTPPPAGLPPATVPSAAPPPTTPPSAGAATTEDTARDAVHARESAFAATMAARDHAGFISFLAEDAVFLSDHNTLRGAEAIAAGWGPLFEEPEAPFSWAPERVEVLDSGNLAISTGPVKDAAGNRTGTFVSTWRRDEDGTWKVVLDTGCRCDCP